MPRKFLKGILIFFCLAGFAGCSTAKDVKIRTYKQDKKRVDQVVEGAVGNWENAPQAVSKQNKETRKMYFLEFSKEPAEPNMGLSDDGKMDTTVQSSERGIKDQDAIDDDSDMPVDEKEQVSPRARKKIELPSFKDDSYAEEREGDSGNQRFVDYKVTKNDTLQKISKKFYDSYSKWPQIYEANKDVLKSPDVLTPGVTLRIPMD